MTKCPKHPQRRRKDCEVCNGPDPESEGTIRRNPYPHVTEDGLTWLDRDGNPPKLDSQGRLAEPFLFVPNRVHGAYELWGVGLKLPDTPEQWRRFVAEIEAKRARTHHKKERD